MTTTIDVPAALGEHMLRGWVMMNQACPTLGCPVPLLRSPSSVTPIKKICVKCDLNLLSPAATTLEETFSTSASNTSHISRIPPTDISESFEIDDFVPPPETEQGRCRREQSDRASCEIAQRLLRNWTLLGEDCPNLGCYGIPLLRPPRLTPNGGLKECVICGTVYLTEIAACGTSRLVPNISDSTIAVGNIEKNQEVHSAPQVDGPVEGPIQNFQVSGSRGITTIPKKPAPVFPSSMSSQPLRSLVSIKSEVQDSEAALRTALRILSTRLTGLSTSPSMIDPVAIGQMAESLGKVAQALTQVRELEKKENASY